MKNLINHLNAIENEIYELILNGHPINVEHALYLYEKASPTVCMILASEKRKQLYGNKVFYNKNIHVEVTNICTKKCKFCSFYREEGDTDSWELGEEEVLNSINEKIGEGITEVHFTGGLNPRRNLKFFTNLFHKIRIMYPNLHIKAFTAVEIEFFSQMEKISIVEVLNELKISGMNSLAGGGAEILNDNIRNKVCPGKTRSEKWLEIHQTAHILGIKSNCTMLYGHIETYADRILHMQKLIELQSKTGGFNCFIPLKYKIYGNNIGIKKEATLIEELKNYAVSRLFVTNIPHLKAYWPMTGIDTAILAVNFGADDIDGTIFESTKIYSMAGAVNKPVMTELQIREKIIFAGFEPMERDSEYNIKN
ncbi:MAG: CofH family radical SAM protein [Bacteroidales bacterium]|jgi:aminodeoxyfutalosine synthase|nr:CofH family radical SAM protein [Bacteroidales bacterium]HOL98257.1 CofH family radical SAM protein [Bacteroidales bacterium]HOM36610.1 CofH family radical SAM protein [Bacteroidales bacterium]HPD24036.1 CofH family radical SAM protein [Bacteroidales bacterium]HRT00013.1 CofH family radical SAM protein [Bacteroidales bacterium]